MSPERFCHHQRYTRDELQIHSFPVNNNHYLVDSNGHFVIFTSQTFLLLPCLLSFFSLGVIECFVWQTQSVLSRTIIVLMHTGFISIHSPSFLATTSTFCYVTQVLILFFWQVVCFPFGFSPFKPPLLLTSFWLQNQRAKTTNQNQPFWSDISIFSSTRKIRAKSISFIVYSRKSGGQSDTAVKEVFQFPPMLDDEVNEPIQ